MLRAVSGDEGGGTANAGFAKTTDLTTASRDAALTDIGAIVQSSSGSDRVLTIQNAATTGWSRTLGDPVIGLAQIGAGAVTFVAGSGVTFNNPTSRASVQYGPIITFRMIATDIWDVA